MFTHDSKILVCFVSVSACCSCIPLEITDSHYLTLTLLTHVTISCINIHAIPAVSALNTRYSLKFTSKGT
jgi:hypothetical protein